MRALGFFMRTALTGVALVMFGCAAGAMPQMAGASGSWRERPLASTAGLGARCKGPYIWQKYVPRKHPNYNPEYYNPLYGPPCRIGIYYGHGRGVVGTRVGDRPYRLHGRRW